MDFLRSFLRRHFAGKPVVVSRNMGCFLRLDNRSHCIAKKLLRICLQLFLAREERVLCTEWQGTKCMIDDSMMGLISSNDQNDITHCRALLEKKVETKKSWKIVTSLKYRKIPKISPAAYIFQMPFLRGLFLERLIFGGAYVRREICVSKSIGLACSGKGIYHFCFVLLCIRGQIPSTSPPGGLYSEGRFNGGFFALRFWGVIFGGAYTFGILR